MICLKEHIWGVICYILTPDGRFRLTTKPTLVWPNGILTCRFSPVHAQEVEQLLYLHSGLAVLLVSVPLGCLTAPLLFIDKVGFP